MKQSARVNSDKVYMQSEHSTMTTDPF